MYSPYIIKLAVKRTDPLPVPTNDEEYIQLRTLRNETRDEIEKNDWRFGSVKNLDIPLEAYEQLIGIEHCQKVWLGIIQADSDKQVLLKNGIKNILMFCLHAGGSPSQSIDSIYKIAIEYAAQKTDTWILCADFIPDKDCSILVCDNQGQIGIYNHLAKYPETLKQMFVKWMPKPKP